MSNVQYTKQYNYEFEIILLLFRPHNPQFRPDIMTKKKCSFHLGDRNIPLTNFTFTKYK